MLPASDDDEPASKTLGMARKSAHVEKHGSMMRLTMYLASLDITTAFDEARPRHVAKNMETHDTHE